MFIGQPSSPLPAGAYAGRPPHGVPKRGRRRRPVWRFAAAASVLLVSQLAPSLGRSETPPRPSRGGELAAPLTLDRAVALFRARGFDALLAEAAVEGARADVRIAGAVPNPAVGASIGKSFAYTPPCSGCDIQYTASISDQAALFDSLSGKRKLRVRVAEAALEAAKMNRADALRTLEFSVKQQFVEAALAESAVAFAREAATVATQTFELVSVRYRAGAVSEADLAKVETAKLEADQAVDAALQSLQTAKVTLAFLVGERTPTADFDIDATPLRDALAHPLPETNAAALTELALSRRPDLRAAAFDQERAAASLALSKRQRFPDIALSVQYVQEGTGSSAVQPPTFSFGISTPLPLFYQYGGEINKAAADYRGRTIQLEKTESQVAAEVAGALVVYGSSRARLDRMQGRLLDRARRARDLVQIQYEKGGASLLELIDAERTLIATNGEYLQDLNDYWTAVFALEQAVGTDLHK